MRFFVCLLVIALACFITGLYAPWWSIAVVGFIISLLLPQRPGNAFLAGFLGVFLLWLVLAALINTANAGILANRIGSMLGVGANPWLLVLITAIVGGLVAGLAALTASYLRVPHKD